MRAGLVTAWRSGARRLAWLLGFWVVWALVIALANVLGLVDARLAFEIAH
jgi:hypothetical protein